MQESTTEERMPDEKHERDSEALDAAAKTAEGTVDETETDEADVNLDVGSGATSVEVPGAESSEPPEESEEPPSLEERIERLEAENAELSDALLRKTADFDNYRKRMLREKEEFVAYANRELLLDIVSIIDDFERAIRSADDSADFAAFHDGVVMIEKQFTSMLERKWKLQRFDSVGEEFDPQKHEAMMTEESSEHDETTVIEDFQKGYMLHDKVLRPAKVKVAMPGKAEA